MKWLDGITNAMDTNLGKLQEMVTGREARHAAVHGVMKSRIQLGKWTMKNNYFQHGYSQCQATKVMSQVMELERDAQ